MEDFPDPDDPTKATDYPLLIFRFMLFSTYTFGLEG